MAAPMQETRSLTEIAQQITVDLGKLATGLAHAGADPNAISGLHRMAVMVGQLTTALGHGPVGAGQMAPGAGGPEAGAPAPAPGGPPEAAGAPPAAAPAGPPQGPRPGERPNGLHGAAAELQARLANAHAKAQQQLAGATQ